MRSGTFSTVARLAVIGAGVAGLGVALCAGRAGHDVVLIERDATPLPPDPAGAFGWDRRGAPQVRHSHAFLARLRNLLIERHPDVLDALLAAGATPLDFIAMLPEGMDRSPLPGDDELVALACRRTTYEWVLRRITTEGDDPIASLLHGRAVVALRSAGPLRDRVPRVSGLRLDDSTTIDADVVVDASGRRSPLPSLLSPLGVDLVEQREDTGIVYFSRFFALLDGAEHPAQLGPIGGDLGFVKYGVFRGDDRTFSVTLAVATDDLDLRRGLLDPDAFLAAARAIPATAPHVESNRSEPITGVAVMAGLVNRRRRFTARDDDGADGAPIVAGLHAVGDAHTCTNPIYGRGCSLAMVQAQLLADALAAHGMDHDARAAAYESASRREITPWYRAAVAQDRMGRAEPATTGAGGDAATVGAPGEPADGGGVDLKEFARDLLRDGLFPAMRVDPVVLRAFLRMFNLLEPPDSLMKDPDVIGRVMAVYATRDQRPPEAPTGPDRDHLVRLLG